MGSIRTLLGSNEEPTGFFDEPVSRFFVEPTGFFDEPVSGLFVEPRRIFHSNPSGFFEEPRFRSKNPSGLDSNPDQGSSIFFLIPRSGLAVDGEPRSLTNPDRFVFVALEIQPWLDLQQV
ncbi:hypothetical protein ACOSQ3_003641 [Xanthoceras sorbifolium]